MSYCIIKEIIIKGKKQNVILLNDELTIMEFDNYDSADKMSKIFEINSDKGWKYNVKKIGKLNEV